MTLRPVLEHSTSIRPLLEACKTIRDLYQIHTHIIRRGYEQDHFLIAQLISICTASRPTNIYYSTTVFNAVTSPNIYLWNILLKAHCENASLGECFALFSRMRREAKVVPDKYTFPPLIKACSRFTAMREGTVVHAAAVRCGTEGDVFFGSSLIDFYGKCHDTELARKVFDGMSVKNEVSWTAMMMGYLNCGDTDAAKWLFDEMPNRNCATWNAMVKGLVNLGDLVTAKKVFDAMPVRDEVSYTTLVQGFAKAGDMTVARSMFEEMPTKDLVSWSALMSGYVHNGKAGEAVKVFGEMWAMNLKPDEYILVTLMSACAQLGSLELAKWIESYMREGSYDMTRTHVSAALIDMNAKCGNMEQATKLFEEMPKRDLVSYCSMIQGLYIRGCSAQAVSLFDKMIDEGVMPDAVAFTVILTTCSHAGLVDEGCRFFDMMVQKYSLIPSPDHYACMVNLLGKSGRLKAAYELIQSMPGELYAGAWGALLGACRMHSDIELGEIVGKRLFEMEPQNTGNYVVLSNIYAEADRWLNVCELREKMSEKGLRKVPGCSYIECNVLSKLDS